MLQKVNLEDTLVCENSNRHKAQKCGKNGGGAAVYFAEFRFSQPFGAVGKLNEGVFVCLNNVTVLEAEKSDKQTDTRGNRLFKTIGKSGCYILTKSGKRKDKEYYT